MKITILEALMVLIKSIVKMSGIFLSCAFAGAVVIGVAFIIYNRKKIIKILRRMSAGY